MRSFHKDKVLIWMLIRSFCCVSKLPNIHRDVRDVCAWINKIHKEAIKT